MRSFHTWMGSKTTPANRPRDPAYAFVSSRPSEKVFNEVSIMIGYAVKPGSESSLEVGGASYALLHVALDLLALAFDFLTVHGDLRIGQRSGEPIHLDTLATAPRVRVVTGAARRRARMHKRRQHVRKRARCREG